MQQKKELTRKMKLQLINDVDTLKSTDNATKIELAVIDEQQQRVNLTQFATITVQIGINGALYTTETPTINADVDTFSFTLSQNLPVGTYSIQVILTTLDNGVHIVPNAGAQRLLIEKSFNEVEDTIPVVKSVQEIMNGMEQTLTNAKTIESNISVALADVEDVFVKAEEAKQTTANVLQQAKRMEQGDYVTIIERYLNTKKMIFKRINNAKAEVILYGEGRHLTYEFYKNTDDMIIQSKVTSGPYADTKALSKSYDSTAATFVSVSPVPTNGVNGYTTTVGATFTVQVDVIKDNADIIGKFYKRYDGGLWEFSLDNQAVKKSISVYNVGTVTEENTLFTGVAKGTHTIVATFKGADPANVVENPRGWIMKTNDTLLKVMIPSIVTTQSIVLAEPSNKEYAFYFKPVNGGTAFQFMPYHGVATAFAAETAKFLNGVYEIPFTTMADGQILDIESFTLTQHLYGRHPDTAERNILEVWCKHAINPQGRLSIDGKLKVLEETYMNNSYVIMGTCRGDAFDKVVTSFNNQYSTVNVALGTNIPMPDERDWARSFAFLSSVNKDYVVAYRYNNIKETLRQDGFSKDANSSAMTYLQNRDASIKKIYSRLFNTATVPANYEQRFSGDYVYATINGIYNLL